jgi:hypothetical protein
VTIEERNVRQLLDLTEGTTFVVLSDRIWLRTLRYPLSIEDVARIAAIRTSRTESILG